MLETKLLGALTTREGYERSRSLLSEEYLSTQVLRDLFGVISRYWEKTEESQVLEEGTLKSLIEVNLDEGDQAVAKSLLPAMYRSVGEDSNLLLGEVISRYSTGQILAEAVEAYQSGTFDPRQLSQRFEALALATEVQQTPPPSPADDVLDILTCETQVRTYPTGIPELDSQLQGGLWAQEIGVVLAPSHRGKTQFLVSCGQHNLQQGRDVIHFTGEISRARTAIRYYQGLLDLDRRAILKAPQTVKARIEALGLPRWRIVDHSAGPFTTADVHRSVRQFVEEGAVHPLIIVDYIDLVQAVARSSKNREDTNLTLVTKELRQIASEFGAGLWTASQVHRPGWSVSHIRMQHVAESIGKVNYADVVVTMNQTLDEAGMGIMRFLIDKARERGITMQEVAATNLKDLQKFVGLDGGTLS
jgi:KaiC/GvpD/RAD55 family RecA-like ATPase